MKRKTHNLKITLDGALNPGHQDSFNVSLPGHEQVVDVLITEEANTESVNYDLRLSNNEGVQVDFMHRLQLASVVNGAAINVPFDDRKIPYVSPKGSRENVDIRLIDPLLLTKQIKLTITYITEVCY